MKALLVRSCRLGQVALQAFRHLQVMLQRRQGLGGPLLDGGVAAVLGLFLKRVHVLAVVLHHRVDVVAVELGALASSSWSYAVWASVSMVVGGLPPRSMCMDS